MEQTQFDKRLASVCLKIQSTKITGWNKNKLSISDGQCIELLKATYTTEVLKRNNTAKEAEILNKTILSNIDKVSGVVSGESPKKGLLLLGTVGSGKTTLAKAILEIVKILSKDERNEYECRNGISPVKWVSAIEIVQIAKEDSDSKEGKFKALMQKKHLFIDDLGCESLEVKNFGNVSMPIVELLSYRYDNMLFTVITTNDDLTSITAKYGERIADRIKEMFRIIAFNNKSYRK